VPAPGGPPQPQAKSDPAAIAITTLILDMIHRVPIIPGPASSSFRAVERRWIARSHDPAGTAVSQRPRAVNRHPLA
jgi:hypothetical protein